jgi:ATP-binding cassette, subfamily C (CFTR/MRP), member 4
MKEGLKSTVVEMNNLFSMGQKQLVCLARAMLLKTNILVLDEATANVDLKRDNFIQQKLREVFIEERKATVLIIAHRLATVIDADRILVMHEGQGVEFDHPFKLMAKNETDSEITNENGYLAKMVKASGKEAEK